MVAEDSGNVWLTVAIIVLFLILAGFGGWYGYRYYMARKSIDARKLKRANDYARRLRAMRVEDKMIKEQLKQAGWPDTYIERALKP